MSQPYQLFRASCRWVDKEMNKRRAACGFPSEKEACYSHFPHRTIIFYATCVPSSNLLFAVHQRHIIQSRPTSSMRLHGPVQTCTRLALSHKRWVTGSWETWRSLFLLKFACPEHKMIKPLCHSQARSYCRQQRY